MSERYCIPATYWGGVVGGGGDCLLPPPKIFWKMFFFFSGGSGFAGGDCGAAEVGTATVLGAPLEKRPCMMVCVLWPIWLQVLLGMVPSRKA